MNLRSLFFYPAVILCLGFSSACSWASGVSDIKVFVGCTPGDEFIKSPLDIPAETKVDFIRWDLTFDKLNRNEFELNIVFGEAQPNTSGFKEDHKKSYRGQYTLGKTDSSPIYHLKSDQFLADIKLVMLNENVFHLLTPQNRLMIGNGGWSYTLNNKSPNLQNYLLPDRMPVTSVNDTSVQTVYDGRTPCQDFATEHHWKVTPSCFKLKWRLILNRDPVSHQPTTYTMRKVVDNEPRDVSGKWTIVKGTDANRDLIIYQLDPDKPNETISLLVGDENILFFLRRDKSLFVGNENFSYTLNKKPGAKQ